jgi:tetratricopeptide (TPR) repeat protein
MTDQGVFQKGRAALEAGAYEEARRWFAAHEELLGTAEETRALVATGETKTAAGDVTAAAAAFQRALERNPTTVAAYLGLARLALFTGDLASAKTHATAATALSPEVGLGWTVLGLVREASGDPSGAVELLQRGADRGADGFHSQFNLGRVLASLRRFDTALLSLERAVRLDPKNPAGHEALALTLRLAGRLDEAVTALEALVAVVPTQVTAWAALGDLHFERKSLLEARQAFDRGLSACGDDPILIEKVMACALLLDDVPGAVAYLEREVVVAPTHDRAWLNLANLSALTSDLRKAEQLARALTARSPARWEAHFILGNVLDGLGRLDEAEAAYRQAVALGPTEWRPRVNLGATLVQQADGSKHVEAVEHLTRALSLVPTREWRAHYDLALAKVRLGARDEARALARTILREAPPDAPIAIEARRLEENLG